MPLQFTPPPHDGLIQVDKNLDAFAVRRRPFGNRSGASQLGNPPHMGPTRPRIKAPNSTYAPHPVYTLNIKDIVSEGSGLEATNPWGFYYLLENDRGHPCARAHVLTDGNGTSRVASLSFGTYSHDTVRVLKKLAIHPLVLAGSFEVRCLLCYEVFLAAIWLKALNESPSFIHPTEKKYHLLEGEPPYPAVDFMLALQPVAEKFMAKFKLFGAQQRYGGTSGLAP